MPAMVPESHICLKVPTSAFDAALPSGFGKEGVSELIMNLMEVLMVLMLQHITGVGITTSTG